MRFCFVCLGDPLKHADERLKEHQVRLHHLDAEHVCGKGEEAYGWMRGDKTEG